MNSPVNGRIKIFLFRVERKIFQLKFIQALPLGKGGDGLLFRR